MVLPNQHVHQPLHEENSQPDRHVLERNPNELVETFFPKKFGGMQSKPSGYDNDKLNSYNHQVVNAIRDSNVTQLRQLLQEGHQCFDACNQNSEYLIHLACRRSDLATIQFLVQEAHVNVHVRDGMGRTILHDACWRPQWEPEILAFLIQVLDPMFLLLRDGRGHSAFDYVRRHDWPILTHFLQERQGFITQRIGASPLWKKYCRAICRSE
eukprot:CAMPEP_0172445294 /NCGR_PEP_ID=MMETSP1065-20121228/5151_1 /TAXON_ID=265537 /ORGANISM="Amphiprora paludosa, Strain CCMP125" /LENGTH=210 /DNA_ID=CAMNT_0013196093 /DNA_START=404 /DNA_END=1036 /DNA_ORIENTATION=+